MTDSAQSRDADGPGSLTIAARHDGNVIIYHVTGEIDSLTAPRLDTALAKQGEQTEHVIVDLTDVPFLSSAGLSVLIDHHERCAAQDVTFSIVATQHAAIRPIQMTALDRVIPLFGSVDDGLRAMGGGPASLSENGLPPR